MMSYHVRVLSQGGHLASEHEVECEAGDLWTHVAMLAAEADDGARLYVTDASGESVAMVGARSAVRLGAQETAAISRGDRAARSAFNR